MSRAARLIVILLLPVVVFASAGCDRREAVNQYNAGIGYLRSQEYPRAILAFNRALELRPDFPEANNSLGYVYNRLQTYDKAIAQFEVAASDVHGHVGDRPVGDSHGGGQFGSCLAECFELAAESFEFGLGVGGELRLDVFVVAAVRLGAGGLLAEQLARCFDQVVDFCLLVGHQLFVPLHPLGIGRGRDGVFEPASDFLEVFHRAGALEDPGQCVVISSRDRIELVVVASSTPEGESEEGSTDGIDLFVDDVVFHLAFIDFGEHFGSQREEPGGNESSVLVCDGFAGAGRHQVTGDLVAEKLVKRPVGIQRVDDPIAVPPGVAVSDVLVESIRVGVAGDIEPVSPPFLTVVRAGQKSFDDTFPGTGSGVGQEGCDLSRRGRQSGEIEADASEEDSSCCAVRGSQLGGCEACEHVTIDWSPNPFHWACGVDRFCRGCRDRSKGPMAAGASASGFRVVGPRVGCSGGDPAFEDADVSGVEFLFGRHLQRVVVVANRLNQQAVVGSPRPNRRPAFASCLPPRSSIESQVASQRFGSSRVTRVAPADQQWADMLFEIGNRDCCLIGGGCGRVGGWGVWCRDTEQENRECERVAGHAVILCGSCRG